MAGGCISLELKASLAIPPRTAPVGGWLFGDQVSRKRAASLANKSALNTRHNHHILSYEVVSQHQNLTCGFPKKVFPQNCKQVGTMSVLVGTVPYPSRWIRLAAQIGDATSPPYGAFCTKQVIHRQRSLSGHPSRASLFYLFFEAIRLAPPLPPPGKMGWVP